ncbi:hypothetical protein [Streptomyces sp. NPDC005012]|uniref:hypothetical protein n=1 Tax=Streptomyces sp. NPDC005012 TaxID=3154558 RepID=UPI0033B5C9F6
MRTALRTAIHALLQHPTLSDAPHSARTAAMVLLAKTNAASGHATLTTSELGRWLGCSTSHINHTVLPELRDGAAEVEPLRGADGFVEGLLWRLRPFAAARTVGSPSDPLALSRTELATLLRLCEALFGPGWAVPGKSPVPAGELARFRGHGASALRLAGLLLVLEARGDGWVRMRAGRLPVGPTGVAGREDGWLRADVTVAGLLGCAVPAAARVVDRLVDAGLLEVVAGDRPGRDRLRVLPVAAAYARLGTDDAGGTDDASGTDDAGEQTAVEPEHVPEPNSATTCGCSCSCAAGDDEETVRLSGPGWQQLGFDACVTDDVSASSDSNSPENAFPQVPHGVPDSAAADGPAEFHTDHAPVVPRSSSITRLSSGFSGSAVRGGGRLRERAPAREDRPAADTRNLTADGGRGGVPLRGEKPRTGTRHHTSAATAGLPIPAGLEVALAPVAWLWARLATGRARWLTGVVRAELLRLKGLLGSAAAAQHALAARLQRRLNAQGGVPVRDFAAWLIGRGLPQRAGCWSVLCDDGLRLDVGAECESCTCLVADRRGARRTAAAEVARRHPATPAAERQILVDTELRDRWERQVTRDRARHEAAVALKERRDRALTARRTAARAEETVPAGDACVHCGAEDVGGECLPCVLAAGTRRGVAEAVDLALTRAADEGPDAVRATVAAAEAEAWAAVRETGARAVADAPDGPGAALARAFAERERARALADEYRARIAAELEESPVVAAEVEQLRRAVLRRVRPVTEAALRRADEVAADARARVVEDLLRRRLAVVRQARTSGPQEDDRQGWAARLEALAARPLCEPVA